MPQLHGILFIIINHRRSKWIQEDPIGKSRHRILPSQWVIIQAAIYPVFRIEYKFEILFIRTTFVLAFRSEAFSLNCEGAKKIVFFQWKELVPVSLQQIAQFNSIHAVLICLPLKIISLFITWKSVNLTKFPIVPVWPHSMRFHHFFNIQWDMKLNAKLSHISAISQFRNAMHLYFKGLLIYRSMRNFLVCPA